MNCRRLWRIGVGIDCHICMGESTSIFIRRFIKIEMCIQRSPYFENFQNKKNFKKKLFRFRSSIWTNPYTQPLADPCFLKLMHAHALLEVVKIVVNWRDPCFMHLRSPEQFEKNAVFVRGLWAFCHHWQKWKRKWIQEVDTDGVPFWHWCRKFDKPRVATKNYQLKKPMKRRKELASEVDIRSFFKKPHINWYP